MLSHIRSTIRLLSFVVVLCLIGGCGPSHVEVTEGDQGSLTDCPTLTVAGVVASSSESGQGPANAIDGSYNTRWSASGVGQHLTADLGGEKKVCAVRIAWYRGKHRKYQFALSASSDGTTFREVWSGASSGTTNALETYALRDVTGRFVRITVNGNTSNASASITELRVQGNELPAQPTGGTSLFEDQTPAMPTSTDTSAVELGMKFRSSQSGSISAIRFYRASPNPDGYRVSLYAANGTELGRATGSDGAAGWQEIAFTAPVPIAADTLYVASYYTSRGGYATTHQGFDAAVSNGPLTAPASATVGGNGVYRYGVGGGFPASTYQASNYFVDVRFEAGSTSTPDPTPSPTPDTSSPSVAIQSPTANATVSGTVVVSGTASDETALAKVEVQVDGGPFAPATGTASWAYSLNTVSFADGSHTLTARATDTSGNTRTVSLSVTVSNAQPEPAPIGSDPTWAAFPPVGAAGTYYVNGSTGVDTNPGTQAQPWKTLAKAAAAVSPGARVLVAPGAYSERLTITRGGTSSAGISFEAHGTPAAKTLGFDVRAQYVRVKGFEVTGGSGAGVRVAADNVQVGRMYVHDMGVGIDTYSGPPYRRNLAVYGNRVVRATFGLLIAGNNTLVENNEVTAIVPRAGYDDCDYSRVFGEGIVFRRNSFHGTDMSAIDASVCHVDDVQFYDNNGDYLRNVSFEGNFFADSHQGMMVESTYYDNSYGITVRNNVFVHNTAWGICIKNNIDGWYIDNNTFVDTQYAGVGCERTNATNINVRNNIFVNMHRAYAGAGLSSYGNNLVLQTRESAAPSTTDLFGVDPRFVNAAARDFRLVLGSPAIDRGTTLDISTDRFGTPRPQGAAFDIGMHEYRP